MLYSHTDQWLNWSYNMIYSKLILNTIADHQPSETHHHDWEGWTGPESQARRTGRALRRHGRVHEVRNRGGRRALKRGMLLTTWAPKLKILLQERNLLSVAYKNVVGARRSSWRVSVERNKLIFSALLHLNPFNKNCSSMLSHALLRLFLPSSRWLREARRSSNLRRSTGRR